MVCTGTPEKKMKRKGKHEEGKERKLHGREKENKKKKAKQTSAEGAGRVPRGQG